VLDFTDICNEDPAQFSRPHLVCTRVEQRDLTLSSLRTGAQGQRQCIKQLQFQQGATHSTSPTISENSMLEMSDFHLGGGLTLTSLSRSDIAKRMDSEFQGDRPSRNLFLDMIMFGSEIELAGDSNIVPPPPCY